MEATLRSEQARPLFDKAIERFKEVGGLAAAAAADLLMFGQAMLRALRRCHKQE
jgi:hypothetical protein